MFSVMAGASWDLAECSTFLTPSSHELALSRPFSCSPVNITAGGLIPGNLREPSSYESSIQGCGQAQDGEMQYLGSWSPKGTSAHLGALNDRSAPFS